MIICIILFICKLRKNTRLNNVILEEVNNTHNRFDNPLYDSVTAPTFVEEIENEITNRPDVVINESYQELNFSSDV